MKLSEAGVGKITAQNTTKDVKPGQTEKEAKKFFGGKGKPKLLHPTAAKNSDPNTLMNLGISESKQLKVQKRIDGFTVDMHIDGKHIGQYTHTRDDDNVRNFAEIFPEYRNKGYGSMLLLAAIKTAEDLGFDFEEDSYSLTPAMSRLYDTLDDEGLIYGGNGAWAISPSGEAELEDFLEESLQELKIVKPDPKDTLGIERKYMPQVKTEDYPEFIEYLEKNGAKFTKEVIPASEIKAMQKEFSDAGIVKQLEKMLKTGAKRKPAIMSSDNYIIDGHHRWLVAVNTGQQLEVYRVNMPAQKLYDLVNKFEKVYYKDIYDETKPVVGVPLSSGLRVSIFPHRPLKVKKSTPGKLRYDEDLNSFINALYMQDKKKTSTIDDFEKLKDKMKKKRLGLKDDVTPVDIAQLERFADKLFGKVGIDVAFTKHFMDRVNDERNAKPITPAELTRIFKQEYKRWGKPIAQLGPDQEAVMKDLATDINIPFALKYDRENDELDLIAKTVMRKKDFQTPNKEFPVEGIDVCINCGSLVFEEIVSEDLRDWFKQKWVKKGKKGKDGKHPPCGTSGKKKGYAKCVPAAKAAKMSKKEKESATRRKRAAQNKAGRGGKDKPGSGKKPINVKTKAKESLEFLEGVNDPHIFKAVFLAGGPGSGKSFVANNILGGTGLRPVNSDDLYEFLMSKEGLALDPETIASPQGQEIRARAKELTGSRKAMYLDGRLGLIIDGTGKDVGKYQKQAEALKSLGYDTMMIFVNTSLEVAQQRNMKRARKLKPEMVKDMWNEVQQNLMKFQQVFGAGRFHIIDNSGGLEDLDRKENFDKVYVETQRFLNTPPSKRAALAWIQQQKAQTDAKRTQPKNQGPNGGTGDSN